MTTYTPPMRRVDATRYGRQTHWYEDANGLRIPGVTTILDQGMPKAALIRWGMNTTAAYAVDHWDELGMLPPSSRLTELKGAAYKDRDAAAKRGTEVHALAEALAHGQEVDVPDELAGHVESYVRFLDDWEPQVVLTEVAVVNYCHGYAGSLDAILRMGGRTLLVDVKTTRSGIYPETAMQLAAYQRAEYYVASDGTEQPMPAVDGCAGIWVRADGYSVVPVDTGEAVFAQFLTAKRTAEWQTETSKSVVLPEMQPEGAQLW